MKKVILAALAIAMVSTMQAQNEVKKDTDCCKNDSCQMDRGDHHMRKPRKEITPTERTQRMTQELNLTDKQQKEVQKLNEQYADAFKGPMGHGPMKGGKDRPRFEGQPGDTAMMRRPRPDKPHFADKDGKGDKPEFNKEEADKLKAKRKEYNEKLMKILTDEQKQKLQEHRQQMMQKRGDKELKQ